MKRRVGLVAFLLSCVLLAACGGVVEPVIPTAVLTLTQTRTPRPTLTPLLRATDTPTPTRPRPTATGGPSPTSIIGPTRTPPPQAHTPTPRPNPNAPRIEFFTANPAYVYPGDPVTLYWSVRGAARAAIYRLDDLGQRNQLWNVDASGSLSVPTSRNDRGTAEFLLTVDSGGYYVEQVLAVPLLCAQEWFFEPEPAGCPLGPVVEGTHIEQVFEGGRMLYVEAEDQVYALFADGLSPAWTAFPNRYVPGQTPDEDPNFVPPPDRFEPMGILGLIWRASDPVRNRLSLGLAPETIYEGAIQSGGDPARTTVYIRSADGSVLRLDPEGENWAIIAPP